MRLNLYGQNRHVVVMDGVNVTGFKEGDWLQIDLEGNEASRTHGGDGPSMNISTAQGGKITIGLNPTSPALGIIYQLREQQKNLPRLFSMQVMTGVEEIIAAAGCAFGKLPQFSSGGDKMQGRDIVIEALEINMDLSGVVPIGGTLI